MSFNYWDAILSSEDYKTMCNRFMFEIYPEIFILKSNNQHNEYYKQTKEAMISSRIEFSNYVDDYFSTDNITDAYTIYNTCVSMLYNLTEHISDDNSHLSSDEKTGTSSFTLELYDGFNENLRKKALNGAIINNDIRCVGLFTL
jgi:hypothetical protein